jgi:transposase-like protein
MTADSSVSVASPTTAEIAKSEVSRLLENGLADLSLRQLLGFLISTAGEAERRAYLQQHPTDKANGYYERSLEVGSTPVEIEVPRVRRGDFRPTSLPAPYRRGYPAESEALLLGLLGSSRSINSAKDALAKMGLSHSERDLDQIASGLVDELDLRNTRPLDPDMLAVFVDGKYIEFRESDKLRSACIYLAIGLGRDGKKRVLCCTAKPGRENLEDWKSVLRNLIERGLRRVMIFVQDDFSGLQPVSEGFFPNADIQLCTVHMQRNAKTHLSKPDAAEFQQRWRAINSTWDLEVGNRQFEELCDRFAKSNPSWTAELRKKRPYYLAFLKYPEIMRKTLCTTNAVEAINGQLEIMRRNSGGYFHSDQTLKFKLGLAISSLENGRWNSSARTTLSALSQLDAMFQARFEAAR